jgi:hypothetical protein
VSVEGRMTGGIYIRTTIMDRSRRRTEEHTDNYDEVKIAVK